MVQLAEIANILESYLPIDRAMEVEEFLLLARNVKVYDVTKKDCLSALKIVKNGHSGLSDAIACVVMKKKEIKEIYSFDRDFDNLDGIRRVAE